jgi:competence protein ComEA
MPTRPTVVIDRDRAPLGSPGRPIIANDDPGAEIDLADLPPLDPDLPRPTARPSWRDQLATVAASLAISAGRMLAGAAALGVAAIVAWRILAPAPPPPQIDLPFASQSSLATEEAPAGSPPTSATVATAGEVVVHVVGAVPTPGVQHLPAGSRVADAVQAAGGATPDADLARVNLAAELTDGQQIYVPRVGESPPTPITPAGPTGDPATGPEPLVDINTATAAELDELPGVGPTTAEAIITTREERGGFTSVDDLLDVRGIGDAKLAELRPRVTV